MYGRYFHAMLSQGMYLAPSQFEAMFVSTAHSDADIAQTIDIQMQALKNLD
jgi:glutamate-1-semialdehyde 2,1-aminomutase